MLSGGFPPAIGFRWCAWRSGWEKCLALEWSLPALVWRSCSGAETVGSLPTVCCSGLWSSGCWRYSLGQISWWVRQICVFVDYIRQGCASCSEKSFRLCSRVFGCRFYWGSPVGYFGNYLCLCIGWFHLRWLPTTGLVNHGRGRWFDCRVYPASHPYSNTDDIRVHYICLPLVKFLSKCVLVHLRQRRWPSDWRGHWWWRGFRCCLPVRALCPTGCMRWLNTIEVSI